VSEHHPTFTCKSCGRERRIEHDCGGDCNYCLAEVGDPDAIKSIEQERIDNGGYLSVDVLVGCTLCSKVPPHVPSDEEECDKCSQMVWVSHGTRIDAEKMAAKQGSTVYYICMGCIPAAVMTDGEIQLGEKQAEEMKSEGLDLEEIMAITGMSLDQLSKLMMKVYQDKERREHGPESKRRRME
jgi:hypothetical protein